jgi:hypothetical protein
MSTAARVKDLVAQLEPGAFVHARDLPGSRASVESAVSRLASDGELVRVRIRSVKPQTLHGELVS